MRGRVWGVRCEGERGRVWGMRCVRCEGVRCGV